MTEDGRQGAYAHLLNLAERYGYVTFDEISNAAETWNLPIDDVDWLTDSIIKYGVLVYDEDPNKINIVDEEDEYDDYAQADYEEIFKKIIETEPSLETFVNEVRQIKPPQFKELSRIIYQAKEGNEYARKRIIEMYLRIALRIALQRAEEYNADLIDCVGNACIGLIVAVDKYNPDTDGKFASYASLWIFQNISREQTTQRPDVYYPVHKKEQYYKVFPILKCKGCIECEKVFVCKKLKGIVKQYLECSEKDAEDAILQSMPFYSLQQLLETIYKEAKDIESISYEHDFNIQRQLIEKITGCDNVIPKIEEKDMKQRVMEAIDTLTPREQNIIRARFGFDNKKEQTLEEVGKDLGVTRERIRQIEEKALHKLSQYLRKKILQDYI